MIQGLAFMMCQRIAEMKEIEQEDGSTFEILTRDIIVPLADISEINPSKSFPIIRHGREEMAETTKIRFRESPERPAPIDNEAEDLRVLHVLAPISLIGSGIAIAVESGYSFVPAFADEGDFGGDERGENTTEREMPRKASEAADTDDERINANIPGGGLPKDYVAPKVDQRTAGLGPNELRMP